MPYWPNNVQTELQTDWHADRLIKQSNVTNRAVSSAEKIYLNKLKSVLYIKIPNGVESLSFFNACQNILNGGGFIDTEDDSRGVKHEEHEDGEDHNQGKIGICLLMIQPFLGGFISL